MSTIYNFNEELPQLGAGPATADVTFVFNTSSGRVKQCTVSQSRYKTVTATTLISAGSSTTISGANSTNTTSTTGFISANEGFINIQATTSGGMVVLPPTAAGQELIIVSPNLKSTGPFQIQVSSSYGSSSPSLDGTNTIYSVQSTIAWGVTLVSLSTVKWAVAGMTGTASTVVSQANFFSTGS